MAATRTKPLRTRKPLGENQVRRPSLPSLEHTRPRNMVAVNSVICLAAYITMSSIAHGYELTANIGLATEFTDNVNLSPDKQSDIGLEIFTSFEYRDRSAKTEGVLDGRLGYRTFLDGNAPDELRPDVHGNLLFHLQPERFSWALDGAWQQVRTDRFGPDSPENLESQFTIWTGPDFRLPLSAITSIIAKGRGGYSNNGGIADGEAQSNYSYGGAVSIVRDRGESETISANLAARAVRYTDDDVASTSSDFTIVDTSAGYASPTARGNTAIEAGVSFVDLQNGDDRTGFFLHADADRRLTPLSRGGLRLNLGYSDETGTAVVAPLVQDFVEPTQSPSTGVFYQQRAEAYYEKLGRRSRLLGTLYIEDQDYVETSANDELRYGATLTLSRRMTRLVEGTIYGTFEYNDFSNQDFDYRDYAAGIALSRRLSQHLSANLGLRHQRRSSDDALSEYDESAVVLAVVYQFGRGASDSAMPDAER